MVSLFSFSHEELQLFQQLLDRTLELRETLRGAHPPLEKGIDSVTGNGQVRHPPGCWEKMRDFNCQGCQVMIIAIAWQMGISLP